jgi:hypothetical protein
MTTANDFILKALFISITLHTVFVCTNYLLKLPEAKKAKEKRVEITYRPPSYKKMDIAQHAIKPAQKLDLQNSLLTSTDTIGVKLSSKDNQDIKGLTMFDRKPVQIKSSQANHITVTPMTSEKINNPIYTTYQDRVRESIKERVYANYSRLDRGNVYLTFIVGSDGSLKDYLIIDGKTQASQNLRYISTKSLKEARFPPFLKGMTLPEYTFNIEIDYQVSND